MTTKITPESLSRIDKLFLDRDAADPGDSRRRRVERGFGVVAGDDLRESYDLQLALLTVVNVAVRTFAGCTVYTSRDLRAAPNLLRLAPGTTLGDAIAVLGGKLEERAQVPTDQPHLLLGAWEPSSRALRVTFDGWRLSVGPAEQLGRLPERSFCPLTGLAAAAIGVGEIFAEFAGISVSATRRIVTLSLWRPDLAPEAEPGIGEPVTELPGELAVFGLGHLGQAYLWAYASLRHADPSKATLVLCDDDTVEHANLETGAIASADWMGKLKTRMAADWLEQRGFKTRLIERRIDAHFRRAEREPVISLCGFDDNQPRQWLAQAGFSGGFDSGLGGEASNFDAISYHSWPNPRVPTELWPVESMEEIQVRNARRERLVKDSDGYQALKEDHCGRLVLAGKSVAVPFVGAFAAAVVLAEVLKAANGGPTFYDVKLRLCALREGRIHARLAAAQSPPVRGMATQQMA